MGEEITIAPAELEAVIGAALMASRTSHANARSVARALTEAEIDGQQGHGLLRVPSYAAQARSGKIDGYATPTLLQTRPGALMIDVGHGFAFPAMDLGIPRLRPLAQSIGIAAAGFMRSHHVGVVGRHVERLAEVGLVALAFANTPKAMPAWGGKRPLLGTNPIAFAAPQVGKPPLVVDLALSQVARGKILIAAQRGEPLPQGWAVDAEGRPTTDANLALKGALQPIGSAKGAALAVMVELMAAALTGGRFGFESSSFLAGEGAPPAVGQLLIAIDPGAFAGETAFGERIDALAQAIAREPGARVPGTRRLALREQAARRGVVVDARLLAEVRGMAKGSAHPHGSD
jgi:(2R)-3-sulfolactate dehydrogenase (NADP+)